MGSSECCFSTVCYAADVIALRVRNRETRDIVVLWWKAWTMSAWITSVTDGWTDRRTDFVLVCAVPNYSGTLHAKSFVLVIGEYEHMSRQTGIIWSRNSLWLVGLFSGPSTVSRSFVKQLYCSVWKHFVFNWHATCESCTVCLCIEAECFCAFRLNVRISCKRVTELDEELVEWAFQLTKSNMQLL